MTEERHNQLRNNCWIQAVETYGTAYIFQEKAKKWLLALQILDFYALVLPISVGAIVISFGADVLWLPLVLLIVGALGVIQLVAFLWAIVMNWQNKHAYAVESAADNWRLSEDFKQLGEKPPARGEFESRYDLLSKEHQIRTSRDEHFGMSQKEKRQGMRAALWQFGRKCGGCGVAPTSMKATNCDVCGNF